MKHNQSRHGFRTNRQLARELNAAGWKSGRSFYAMGRKWTGARTCNGQLEICMCNRDWTPVPEGTTFDDGMGNQI